MKKHAFIVLALMFVLLFAAVSCNPEVKADPLDEQKQSIPAENVDMTNAPAVTEEQQNAFKADWMVATESVSNGLIAKAISQENVTLADILNYYFNGRVSKSVDEGTSEGAEDAAVSVLVASLSGELSMEADAMTLECTSTSEGSSEPVVETIAITNVSAKAELSGKSITLVVTGTINEESFSAVIFYSIDDNNTLQRGKSTFEGAANEELYKKIENANIDVLEISGMTVEAKAIAMNANIVVEGCSMKIPATAKIEGKASVEINKKSTSSIKINSFALSVDLFR